MTRRRRTILRSQRQGAYEVCREAWIEAKQDVFRAEQMINDRIGRKVGAAYRTTALALAVDLIEHWSAKRVIIPSDVAGDDEPFHVEVWDDG